jgi:hypothetical protein
LVSLISWQSEKGNAKPIASAPPFPHCAQPSLTDKPPRPTPKIGNNDQCQSNQSSVIEMLVDWLFEKASGANSERQLLPKTLGSFSFFGTWAAIINFT